MKKIAPIFLALISANALSVETSSDSTVNVIQVYPEYGGGDFIFKIAKPTENCDGYWATPSMPGFDGTISTVLSALHSGKKVRVYAKTEAEHRWPGSSGYKYCKIYAVNVSN